MYFQENVKGKWKTGPHQDLVWITEWPHCFPTCCQLGTVTKGAYTIQVCFLQVSWTLIFVVDWTDCSISCSTFHHPGSVKDGMGALSWGSFLVFLERVFGKPIVCYSSGLMRGGILIFCFYINTKSSLVSRCSAFSTGNPFFSPL